MNKQQAKEKIKRLTDRQLEVIAAVSLGKTNEEIAQELSCTLKTIKTHLYQIFPIIEVTNRVQAALLYLKANGKLK